MQIKATYVDHMGSDLSVVNAARVSFGKKSDWSHKFGVGKPAGASYPLTLSDRDARLVRYLAKHKHLSPFGHCFTSFHVKAPIFVARQLVKHKFLRWNEISRRYVDDPPEYYVPDKWRGRSKDKKQGSEGFIDLDTIGLSGKAPPHESGWEASLLESVHENYKCIFDNYDALLLAGVAPEQARMVLPQSTMTEWYWSGSLDAFSDMCNLRCKEDTQYETRLVANQIDEIMGGLYPHSWKALRT